MNSEHITDEQKVVEICERIGFGRVQQIAGDAWEQRHNCAPRGRMGVTVRNEKPAAQPLPEHADHVSEIAARLRLVAKLAGCPQAVPENDHTAVGAIFSVLGNMRRAMERQERAGADAAIRLAPHLHIGACITEGRLHATVMHKAGNGPATVVAMAEMAVDALKEHDCIATMTPAAPH